MNSIVIAFVIVIAVLVVIYTIRQNRKDEKELEDFLNNDYRHPEETDEPNDDRH